MPKCKIICNVRRFESRRNPDEKVSGWEVDEHGKLWPCCVYGNLQYGNVNEKIDNYKRDPYFHEEMAKDPDFNNLTMHTAKKIMAHPLYAKYINEEGWNSENPPPICVETCGITLDEDTGKEVRPEQLSVNLKFNNKNED